MVMLSLAFRRQELFDVCALNAQCWLHRILSARGERARSNSAGEMTCLKLICFISCRFILNASCPICHETLASTGMNAVFCSTVCLALQKSAVYFRISSSCQLLAQTALFMK